MMANEVTTVANYFSKNLKLILPGKKDALSLRSLYGKRMVDVRG
jgi:hypothetical protein